MKPHFLLIAFLTVMAPAVASADRHRDFGERFWVEASSGLGSFTGIEDGSVSIALSGTVGFKTDENSGLELSMGGAVDPVEGISAFGVSAMGVWFPGTDHIRLRAGPRLRVFAIDPGLSENGLLCLDTCEPYTGGETTDLGVELGALSQWNFGPFFFSIEWFGLYQPLVTLDAKWVYHQPYDYDEKREDADWAGVDLPAELRFFTFGAGATF